MSKGVERRHPGERGARKRTSKFKADKAFCRRVRLALLDLKYAESGHAAPVTIEVRGNRVIETRGQDCIASRCGVYRQCENGGCYAVYR